MAKRDIRNFNPNIFAKLEADMWIAYYNHKFLSLFVLLFRLSYSHFHPNPFTTVSGAYHTARAAMVFRMTRGNEDRQKILKHLTKFYRLLSDRNEASFNYQKAAELELEWWLVDRYPKRYEKTRAVALSETMAAVYSAPADKLTVYGEKRAAAMELLGDFHRDPKSKVEWVKLRKLLQDSFRALHNEVCIKDNVTQLRHS